jgi:hypothetical protein
LGDIIRFQDKFYVLASSSLADNRTRVLKYGETFGVFNVAIEMDNHSFADIKHVDDLGKQFVNELEEFFVNYHDLSGKKYWVLGAKGPKEAERRIKEGMRTFKKNG